jgi:hypothetical protein
VINILSKKELKKTGPILSNEPVNCKENSTPSCMANAEQRANSAKEDKNLMQDVISLLSGNYSEIILMLPKE